MSYNIEFKSEATIGFETLTSTIQERILRKIRWLSENFEDLTPQPLSADLSGLFKLRIGDYRVIYSFNTEAHSSQFIKLGIVVIFTINNWSSVSPQLHSN